VDELKIYNYPLSASEIKADYNRGNSLVMGSSSTTSDGKTADNSSDRSYCPPGDTTASCAPLAEWKFEERTGTAANDTSGNGNTGTLSGGPLWKTGKIGAGLYFDGNDDQVTTSNGNSIKGLTQFTIEMWFNPSRLNGTEQQLYNECINSSCSTRATLEIDTDNKLYFGGRAPDSDGYTQWIDDARTLTVGTWYHVVAVFDSVSDVQHIYLNGVDQSASVTEAAITNSNPNEVPRIGHGWSGGTTNFNGLIDEVKIYNYARTQPQVAWDYNRGAPVGWWKFNECQGSNAYDSSGNSYTGTITVGSGATQNTAGTCTDGSTSSAWYNGRSGKYNASLNFDGTDDYVTMGNVLDFERTNPLTISAWVNIGSITGQVWNIVAKMNSASPYQGYAFDYHTTNNQLEFKLNNTWSTNTIYVVSPTISIEDSQWHHLVVTYDGSVSANGVTFYLDGRQLSANTNTYNNLSATTSTSYPFNIGTYNNYTGGADSIFHGQMDDVRIYNYSLNPTQLKTLYNGNSAFRFGPSSGNP
jgi:hypothetical protein